MASIATNLYNSAAATMWVRKSVHLGLNRLFHQTSSSSSSVKGNLSKLRKKTGFSFINCKKALEKFENDIEKAEVWLKEQAQKEGWSKATKLKDRATAQGLIGLICQDQCATMVEVNCETDFVARNNKFQHFVGQAASSTLAECKKMNDSSEKAVKKILSADELKNIPVIQESKSLGELLVLTIGQIGENMSLRRGIFINAPSGSIIGSYVHSALANPKSSPSGKFTLGKYAALVLFRRTGETQSGTPSSDIGRRLSQHVVGMNPKIIGEYKPPTAEGKYGKPKGSPNNYQDVLKYMPI
ncbi:putative elongation factor Ts, mitochondrial [Apostichopus japonicus]|uniref:Elongation factor Ts, mitochondrial n=1 Tax=Stichopus japonicus TaxID=307972 RepID=A0A2G8LKY8_STIJA|nr:putative elongation factor Ts, mitochondrial [Apostichopus japonicus]